MDWCKRLSRHWHELDLHSTEEGCSEETIVTFELRHFIQMPSELRLYFKCVDGMSMKGGHDMDNNGFSFLPLVMVESVADFSLRMGWRIGTGINPQKAFVFVDYLQWSCAYAFETSAQNAGAIYLLGYEMPIRIASSMSDFSAMYLSDDPHLYHL